MEAVHDTRLPGSSSVEVDWVQIYAVTSGGDIPIVTTSSLTGVTWAGTWARSPWFDGNSHVDIPAPPANQQTVLFVTSSEPDRVWHWGGDRFASVPAGTTAFVAKARLRITGPAAVHIGLDFWRSSTAPWAGLNVNNTEAGIGDWHFNTGDWMTIEVRLSPPLIP